MEKVWFTRHLGAVPVKRPLLDSLGLTVVVVRTVVKFQPASGRREAWRGKLHPAQSEEKTTDEDPRTSLGVTRK